MRGIGHNFASETNCVSIACLSKLPASITGCTLCLLRQVSQFGKALHNGSNKFAWRVQYFSAYSTGGTTSFLPFLTENIIQNFLIFLGKPN